MVLFLGQSPELFLHICASSVVFDIKFPDAGAQLFGLDFSHAAVECFHQCIMDEHVLSLKMERGEGKGRAKLMLVTAIARNPVMHVNPAD